MQFPQEVRDCLPVAVFFYLNFNTINYVEFRGPLFGAKSVLDIRIEGFNTPWIHAKNRPGNPRRFLV